MILPEVNEVSSLYHSRWMSHDDICFTNYGLAYAIIAVAKVLKVSALNLRLIAVYEDDPHPDYDVYLNGKLVGCIHYYIPF